VITRWTIREGNFTGSPQGVTLRVLRGVSGDTFLGVRSGEPSTMPTGDAIVSFASRVPISAGDRIGIDHPITVHSCAGTPGSSQARWNPQLADGEERAITAGIAGGGCETEVQATVEPDADGDGFGDETQDGCPSNSLVQSACPAGQPAPVPPSIQDTAAPDSRFRLDGRKPTIGVALRRGIKLKVTSNEAVTIEADAYVRPRGFVAVAPVGSIVLGRRIASLSRAGTKRLTLRLASSARPAFRHRRRVTLRLEVSARDSAGNITTRASNLTLSA
jgi:hypothetical protein